MKSPLHRGALDTVSNDSISIDMTAAADEKPKKNMSATEILRSVFFRSTTLEEKAAVTGVSQPEAEALEGVKVGRSLPVIQEPNSAIGTDQETMSSAS